MVTNVKNKCLNYFWGCKLAIYKKWFYLFIFGYCFLDFSLFAASGEYSVAAVRRLLIAVASLVVEPGLQGWRDSIVVAPGLESIGSIAVALGLSCSAPCGIFLDQGSNSCLLHWQVNSLPLSHQGSLEIGNLCQKNIHRYVHNCIVLMFSSYKPCKCLIIGKFQINYIPALGGCHCGYQQLCCRINDSFTCKFY